MSRQNHLTIYGASDDLIEVDGRITEEYYTSDTDGLHLTITNDGKKIEFVIVVEYSGEWMISVAGGGRTEFPVEIEWGERPDRDDDPAITFTLAPDDEVTLVPMPK